MSSEKPPKNGESEGLSEKFYRGSSLVESSPQAALALFEAVQKDVQALSLFSDNETVEDISNKSIPFLALEHLLAMALVGLPAGPGKMQERRVHVHQSLDLWSSFIGRLEQLELLSNVEIKEYHELMEEVDFDKPMRLPDRDAKIARFKAKQQATKEVDRLKAMRERRGRMGLEGEDELDGHNDESLDRSVALSQLSVHKIEAFENWAQSKREIPMIEMMVKMEEERATMDRHTGSGASQQDQRPPPSAKPLQVTHITKDSTGQIQIKRDEIRSKVFRPSWNQPTMSLEELGDREYHQAIEREERQKIAEAERSNDPRRYEELMRDGLEDDVNLVDASAKLDRDWDDFKDENPRGSGNKHANRGDKNF
jgi:immunoglobulin-binding protein 1